MDNNLNNFFQQQIWNNSKNLLHHQQQQHQQLQQQQQQLQSARNEITSTDKSSSAASTSILLAPSKLSHQQQPPHSTNRDLSIDNRIYLDGLRQQQQQHQQQLQHSPRTFTPIGSNLSISTVGGGRDSNNNNNNNGGFSNPKLLNRLDIDTIRNNINNQRNLSSCSGSGGSLLHHQHGTILFNTLNGGALGSSGCNLLPGSTAECFSIDGGPNIVDSTTPPPSNHNSITTAISMPPPASSASSSSSTISTNIGLNRSSSGSQDVPEKIKTPNSIRGECCLEHQDYFHLIQRTSTFSYQKFRKPQRNNI